MIKKVKSRKLKVESTINISGFSLLELLVVIGIISMLVALAFPNFFAARQRARDTQRKSDLKQVQKALELVKMDQSPVSYPTGVSNALAPACGVAWTAGTNTYMQKTPCDPLGPTPYYYNRTTTLNYQLTACLENASDPDKDASLQGGCTTASYTINEP